VPEGFDLLDQETGERQAHEGSVEGVELCLKSGDLVHLAAELGGLAEESFLTYRQAGKDLVQAGEVLYCRGAPGDQDRPRAECRPALGGVLVNQTIDFTFSSFRVLLCVGDEKSVKSRKREKTNVVPGDRVAAVDACPGSRPQPETVGRKVIEPQKADEIDEKRGEAGDKETFCGKAA
jgi:hypothetical protein